MTRFQILPKAKGAFNTTTANVMPLQQVETPFYAKAVKSKLRLSEQAKAKIGIFDEAEYVAPICNEVTSEYGFWGNLCKWSLKNDVINKQQINDFISSPINSQQDDKALVLINDVMGSINKTAQSCLKRSATIFSDIEINKVLAQWFKVDDSEWGMNVSFFQQGEFGNDCDENGESNDGMAIRLASDCFVGTLSFDIDSGNPKISNTLYNMLTDLASLAYKASTFEMIEHYGVIAWDLADFGEDVITDFAKEITQENFDEFSKIMESSEYDEIKDEVSKLAPKAMAKYGLEFHDELPLRSLQEYLDATKCLSLYVRKIPKNNSSITTLFAAYIQEIKCHLRHVKWYISEREQKKLNSIVMVIQRVIDNYDASAEGDNNAWINGSNISLYESNFISFGTSTEDYFLDNMQDNNQCTGELACLKLNLHSEHDYEPLLKNICLIDTALIALAQIINQN
ncbi:hypothetical protein [Photobacterium toruni]|uniref:hypothetical protein n=1 Tax=Photobacterium toruni TaxID=1935446 RepID=UPI002110E0B5|nr:hypothetical protein [Photobacterium toruni]